MPDDVKTHPVQTPQRWGRDQARIRESVTLRAYKVYRHLYGAQEALITGHCRGGFGVGELVAFLYARSFPKEEWTARFDEALIGMKGLS